MTGNVIGKKAVGERDIVAAMPEQRFRPVLAGAEMSIGLQALSPHLPWAHYFDLEAAGQTIDPSQPVYWEKAKSLKLIGTQVVEAVPYLTQRRRVEGLSVLDLACAEGQHSIELAMAGAGRVVGVDGRRLYVDRASFIARCFGAANARFVKGDVRAAEPDELGTFDLVLFFGILHHLAPDDFYPMLQRLRSLTQDAVLIYTHTADDAANRRWGQRLGEPMRNAHGYVGRPFREHDDHTTPEQREKRLRSSLDNTFSFWAEESELLRALQDAGFRYVARQLAPNPFPDPPNEFRVLYVARV